MRTDPTDNYPNEQLEQANLFLAMTDNELFETLGKLEAAEAFPSDWFNVGREKYQRVVMDCRTHICGPKIRAVLASDATHLVCAVADVIGHAVVGPIPAMTIATIIVHQGLEKFCGSMWK